MKNISRVPSLLLTVMLACSLFIGMHRSTSPLHAADAPAPSSNSDLSALQAEVQRLKGLVPDQSHAMADVGYHFANLWFAAGNTNWPLAKFYFDETRSHLNWAVRIIPVRKTPAGQDLDLKGILGAIDNTIFSEVGRSIDSRDKTKFVVAYKQAIEGCYSCHKAAGKPYLRPQIPLAPPQPILNFDPDAKWPE
ncbi:MAG TPA: hypothetical protein VHH73_12580 [Verrucomicrobiae bacterium]|nr:hypothetical protein [Verrucomicrobiae bacterium]